eukprot:XP_014772270.1 PREDICTED: uncharacterized protein LOC106870640 [Octopus bimaculoides]
MNSVVNLRMLATAFFLIASGNPIQDLPKENGDEEKLRNAEERIFRHILKENPEFATYYSFHDYNDKLESFSLEAFQRRKVNSIRIVVYRSNDIYNTTSGFVHQDPRDCILQH